jgi:hypothetical protein
VESHLKILILAWPGRSRDILVALLKTLPGADLFPLETVEQAQQRFSGQNPPDLVLVDQPAQDLLPACRELWPGAGCIFLVEGRTYRRAAFEADCVLSRSAPAGELLAAVSRLSAWAAVRPKPALGKWLPLAAQNGQVFQQIEY